jgi:alkanesulfonate monooxygenase SsuD/methylene tetrahydromethanopterin reductase-like flavin-dependent oxidoreductase (luciferase family)
VLSGSDSSPALHLGVALDGAGWHPAAWREPEARPTELLEARYWADLAAEAESGRLDFLTIEDGLRLQSDDPMTPDDRTDRVRGRLDAVLIAARIAPTTRHIGFLPTAITTHTEPFHVSKAIATLDYVSTGRGGVRLQVSLREHEAAHFGRRSFPAVQFDGRGDPVTRQLIEDQFDEAGEYVEVLRRLWDSWEDDAEIRDVATGRFVDRDKLHYIDFQGRWLSVKGPAITPRPPQGQPLIAALAHQRVPYQFVARSADIGFVTPSNANQAADIVEEIRGEQRAAGRVGEPVQIFADLLVHLDQDVSGAVARKRRLDDAAGAPYTSDAHAFVGTPAQLADLLIDWQSAGLTGFRLRPATLPHDLTQITRHLVPELQRRGVFRTEYEASTLRGLLGLPRPVNRYTAV